MLIARISQYLFGMVIIYLGTTLAVKSTIGAGFWSALFVGLSNKFIFSVGVWFVICQILIVFFNAWLLKSRPEWLAIIPILLEGAIFDFWLEVVFKNVDFSHMMLWMRIGIFSSALVIASLGIALYVLTGYPRSPVDQLFVSISQRFQWKMGVSQSMVALVVTGFAYILGGPVGVGTVLSIFLYGPFIEVWLYALSMVTRRLKLRGSVHVQS